MTPWQCTWTWRPASCVATEPSRRSSMSAALVEDESRAEDCGDEDRERDAHVGKIGNRPANA